jgi:hypothetical protein
MIHWLLDIDVLIPGGEPMEGEGVHLSQHEKTSKKGGLL